MDIVHSAFNWRKCTAKDDYSKSQGHFLNLQDSLNLGNLPGNEGLDVTEVKEEKYMQCTTKTKQTKQKEKASKQAIKQK